MSLSVTATLLLNASRHCHLQGFPEQPVPGLENPFGEEIFPSIQSKSKPPLEQLEASLFCSTACFLWELGDYSGTASLACLTQLYPEHVGVWQKAFGQAGSPRAWDVAFFEIPEKREPIFWSSKWKYQCSLWLKWTWQLCFLLGWLLFAHFMKLLQDF